jgi:hypothetical protein
MKKNRRRADRQAQTLAQNLLEHQTSEINADLAKIAERNAARRLVGCPGCNVNFYRDVCNGTSIPAHYRLQPNGAVGLCAGSEKHFRRPHDEGAFMS